MIRILALAAGLSGAAGLSQFPEYSQQYIQRLSGAVDELDSVVATFDADASGLGMTRPEALADLAGGGRMGEARALSMERTFARHARLSAALTSLETSSSTRKILKISTIRDQEITRETLKDFRPAIPMTLEGLGFGAAGFGLGYGIFLIVTSVIGLCLRRRV
ncbi:MAG: DUF2937 family protein [Rhodobacteraceae bacterium]|jgi:hypothetical protein|nr:DUF2937 family protein [Paracoccaceae bacterium]